MIQQAVSFPVVVCAFKYRLSGETPGVVIEGMGTWVPLALHDVDS